MLKRLHRPWLQSTVQSRDEHMLGIVPHRTSDKLPDPPLDIPTRGVIVDEDTMLDYPESSRIC
jgi:hypothetical protein